MAIPKTKLEMETISSIDGLPSLSYEPATLREEYPGAMAINAAANKPARLDHNSFVNKYVAIAVNPLKNGARKTQISRI